MSKTLLLVAVIAALAVSASAQTPLASLYDYDEFVYDPGNLNTVGAPTWAGTAAAEIQVTADETCEVFSNSTGTLDSAWAFSAYAGANNNIIVQLKAKKGGSAPGNEGSNMFDVYAYAGNGQEMGRWYGAENNIKGRYGGTVTATVTLTDEWQTLEMRINTSTKKTQYYVGQTLLGELGPTSMGAKLAKIQFNSWNRGYNDSYVFFDDVGYGTPEPSSLLALSAFGVGMIGYIKRRRA